MIGKGHPELDALLLCLRSGSGLSPFDMLYWLVLGGSGGGGGGSTESKGV